MKFEFDPAKSQSNKAKHGIDFEEAQALWNDVERVEAAARSEIEPRSMVVGNLLGTYWSAFITYREDVVRIISVRRSRESEVLRYEKAKSSR
jgi:uncharacterized DUF497 family protein